MNAGQDCGKIAWVEVDSHRWHLWKPRGGWIHFPFHCPSCQKILDPTGRLFKADAQQHYDCDGHLQTWNGSLFVHSAALCEVCNSPALEEQIKKLLPGRAPTEKEIAHALDSGR